MRGFVRPIKRLKLERTTRRISQQNVGEITLVPQPVISLAESGRLIPTDEQLNRLATFYEVPADELLRDVIVMEHRR